MSDQAEMEFEEQVATEQPEAVVEQQEQPEVQHEIAAVSLGDPEEPKEGEEPTDRSPGLVNKLRKLAREKDKELRELREKLKASTPAPVPQLGPKPRFEDSYDSDKFAADLLEWEDRRRAIAAEEAKAQEQQRALETDYQSRLSRYEESKALLPFDDFDVAEEAVMQSLSETQRALLIKAAIQPDVLVYGLGNSPDKLKTLAAISDPVDFVRTLAWLEAKELKVEKRTATRTEPERVVRGTAPLTAVSLDKKLQALEDEADRTGDRTKVLAYRRELKARERQAALR